MFKTVERSFVTRDISVKRDGHEAYAGAWRTEGGKGGLYINFREKININSMEATGGPSPLGPWGGNPGKCVATK